MEISIVHFIFMVCFFSPTVFTNAGISSDLFAIVPVGMIFGINAKVLQMLEAVQICLKLFLLG